MQRATTGRRTSARLLAVASLAILVLLVFLGIALRAPRSPLVHVDSERDFLLANACAASPACRLVGAPTSLSTVHQGGLWIVSLALAFESGLDPDDVRLVVIALFALATALLALVGERIGGRVAGFLAAALFLATGEGLLEAQVLWNPSLLALPSVLALAALVTAAVHRDSALYVGASLAVAVAVQLHPVALALVPAALVVLFLRPPPRPIRTLAASIAVFLASVAALSRDAVPSALRALVVGRGFGTSRGAEDLPFALAVAGGAALLLIAAIVAARRRPSGQSTALLVAAVASAGPLLLVGAATAVAGHALNRYYVVPFLPGIALVVAFLATRPLEVAARIPSLASRPTLRDRAGTVVGTVLAAGGLAWGSAAFPGDDVRITHADVATLERRMPDLGLCSYEAVVRQVSGPGVEGVRVGAQGLFDRRNPCAGRTRAAAADDGAAGPRYIVDKAAPPDGVPVPRALSVVPLGGPIPLLVLPVDPVVDTARAGASVRLPDGGSRALRPGLRVAPVRPFSLGIPVLAGLESVEAIASLEVSYPIRVPTASAYEIVPCAFDPHEEFELASARLEGLAADGPLAHGTFRLAAGQEGAEGRLVLTWSAATGTGDSRLLPDVLVLRLDDPGVPALATALQWRERCARRW